MVDRRSLLCGLAALPLAGTTPASAAAAADAHLIALVDAYAALDTEVNTTPSTAPHYDSLMDGFRPLEDEIAAMPAAGLAGLIAKARVCQICSIRCCETAIPLSVADDVWCLLAGGARG